MIFKRQSKIIPNNQPQLKSSWKQKFKMLLYQRNYNNIIDAQHTCHKNYDKNDCFDQAAVNLINEIRRFPTDVEVYKEDNDDAPGLTHLYCNFIPLKKSVQFDDEIVNTFVYLRNLKELNKLTEQDNFYSQIRKFLKACKQAGKIVEGWESCLKRFIVHLDVIKRIQIYLCLLRNGTKALPVLHQLYAKAVLIDIFLQRVISSSQYFQKQARLNTTWKISLEIKDKINEANISKTMKMLYCSICLIYDCGKHKLQDTSHNRDHHYSSPKNYISKFTHIQKAIQLLKELKDIECGQNLMQQKCCSQTCFRKLNKKTYMEMEIHKTKAISPMVQSIIKMGVQIFSYSPCKIHALFPKYGVYVSKITCCMVFMYLIQQANLQAKLDFKINSSEVQYLMNEVSDSSVDTLKKNLMNLRKRKVKNIKLQDYKYQQVAICFHHFIGDQPIDRVCQNCFCFRRGFCLPECQCGPNCPIMIAGCSCKSKKDCQTLQCPCYKFKIECIPGVCHNCFPSCTSDKKNGCKNDQILRGCSKMMKIGFSKIPNAGFGAFAFQNIKKGSLVSVYCGEVLDQQMETIRQTLKKGESFYNFACYEGSIDARFMGNKTRFINHANQLEGKTNLVSLNMFSLGQQHIGLYALRDIKEGEQLLFDYDIEGELAKTYSHAHEFLKKDSAKEGFLPS